MSPVRHLRGSGPDCPSVSVCTPTYNGLPRLQRAAKALLPALRQDDEWVVSVDGSTDGTIDYVRSLEEEDPRVHAVVNEHNAGRAVALNAACRSATRTLVLRLDDDIIVDPYLVQAHATMHACTEGSIGVIQSVKDVGHSPTASERWLQFLAANQSRDAARMGHSADSLPASAWGAVCSVRHDVGSKLGWYDTRFTNYGWEDIEFGHRLRLAGIRLRRCPSPPPQHLAHVVDFKGKLDRNFFSGASMAVFASIHGREAVSQALGIPEGRREPAVWTFSGRSLLLSPRSRRLLTKTAVHGERILSRAPSRMAYDVWVARWLVWAQMCGWVNGFASARQT